MGSFADAIVPHKFKTALKTEPVSWGRFFVFIRRLLRFFTGLIRVGTRRDFGPAFTGIKACKTRKLSLLSCKIGLRAKNDFMSLK